MSEAISYQNLILRNYNINHLRMCVNQNALRARINTAAFFLAEKFWEIEVIYKNIDHICLLEYFSNLT